MWFRDNPLLDFVLLLVGVGIVLLLLLLLTGNVHCWNVPFFGRGCNIG